jgi:hypothetical protein
MVMEEGKGRRTRNVASIESKRETGVGRAQGIEEAAEKIPKTPVSTATSRATEHETAVSRRGASATTVIERVT